MPTYEFRNKETGETFEQWMYMAEREKFLEENPQLEQIHTKGISSVSGVNMKVPSGFKDVLKRIHKETPGSRLNIKEIICQHAAEKTIKNNSLLQI